MGPLRGLGPEMLQTCLLEASRSVREADSIDICGDPAHFVYHFLRRRGDPAHFVNHFVRGRGDPVHFVNRFVRRRGDPVHSLFTLCVGVVIPLALSSLCAQAW